MFVLPTLKPEEIIIYLRKSRTDDPALTVSETVAKHEQMLDDWCMRNLGAVVPEQNRFREIVSGETIEARPEIKKVLRLIEQDKFKAILIVEPQRLSRGDLEDIGRISKILRYTHTIVITLQYSYDLQDERDRDYFERELKRGNEYLEYSKRIMQNGRALSCERGNYIGSCEPYGYKKVVCKDGKHKYTSLEIVEHEADIIRVIFQMYAAGNGATKICTHLNNIGVKPKSGEIWTPACIYNLLDNPLFNGKIKWGERKEIKVVENGEIVKHRPISKDFQLYEGKHNAIISDALWSAVRARRDAHTLPKVKKSTTLQNPFSGLIYCECGRMMIRRPYSGRCEDRLQCPNQTYCNNASCTMSEMFAAVADALSDAIADFQVHISGGNNGNNNRAENLRILQSQLSELEKKESSLWEKYAEEGMPKRIFDDLISKVEKQKADISAMIEQEESAPVEPDYEECTVLFSQAITAISEPDIPAEVTNNLLKACIKRITYHRERGQHIGRKWILNPMHLDIELNF